MRSAEGGRCAGAAKSERRDSDTGEDDEAEGRVEEAPNQFFSWAADYGGGLKAEA